MAIKNTPYRGIPYPDKSENVNDALHWQNAMLATDVQLDLLKRETLNEVPGIVGTEIAEALANDPTVAQAAADAVAAELTNADLVSKATADATYVPQAEMLERTLGLQAYATATAADTHQQTIGAPYLYDEVVAVVDDMARISDGPQFFAMVKVGHRPGTWRDMYYGYVSGHGGYSDPLEKGYNWLVTAPTPYGPWTWGEKVTGTDSTAIMQSRAVGPRTIAPEAMWVGNEIWLTYHGLKLKNPWTENYDYSLVRNAPSVLAKSTDGINFTEHGIVVDVDEDVTDASPYSSSTSYRRTIKDGSLFHSVWQGNTTWSNDSVGIFTYTCGHAISADGIKWRKQPPLIMPEVGDQGVFAPSLVKVANGWLIACVYRRNVAGVQVGLPRVYFSERLEPGSFRSLGDITMPVMPNRTESMISPFFFMHEGILHMAYGTRTNAAQMPVIAIAKVGWK